jgi:hypothetical protein
LGQLLFFEKVKFVTVCAPPDERQAIDRGRSQNPHLIDVFGRLTSTHRADLQTVGEATEKDENCQISH